MTALRVVLVCLMLVSVAGLSIGAADSSYSISPQETVDIDSRTVEFESENYTVSQVGHASVNGDLTVTTAGPDNGTYDLYLYNSDRNIVTTSSPLSGTATTTFDLDSLGVQAGTYVLVINDDGERKVVLPVVANGYDISIDAPNSATVGENVTVSLSVSQKEGVEESIRAVKLQVKVGGDSRQITATKTADGTYEATIDIDQAGTFSIYAGIQGPDKVSGQYELIAITDPQTIEASEQTATETSSDGGGDQSTDTSSTDTGQSTSTTQTTTTSQSTTTASSTATPTEPSTETGTATTTATPTASTDITDTATVSETETAESVVTPANSETSTTTTTTDTGLAVSLAVLLALLAGWARSNRE
jgi:hypothetical protein